VLATTILISGKIPNYIFSNMKGVANHSDNVITKKVQGLRSATKKIYVSKSPSA